MSEMVERVAKAIAAAHFARKQWYGACSKAAYVAAASEREWRTFAPAALAAISAMRELTDDMEQAFADTLFDRTEHAMEVIHAVKPAWDNAVDAALKD